VGMQVDMSDIEIDLGALLLPSKKFRRSNVPPRPLNQFMLFRKSIQKSLREKYPALLNSEISRIAGLYFKGLSQEQKSIYADLAKVEAEVHKMKYPNYKYKPRAKVNKRISLQCTTQIDQPTPDTLESGLFNTDCSTDNQLTKPTDSELGSIEVMSYQTPTTDHIPHYKFQKNLWKMANNAVHPLWQQTYTPSLPPFNQIFSQSISQSNFNLSTQLDPTNSCPLTSPSHFPTLSSWPTTTLLNTKLIPSEPSYFNSSG
ncbi:Transcription factor SOX-6, partial [Massospora cicadina]